MSGAANILQGDRHTLGFPPDGTAGSWPAFLAFSVGSAILMLGVAVSAPDPSGQVALVYAPGVSATQALLRASATGARLIRQGRVDWIIVVAPEADDPGFSARARAGGALAVLNPWIAGGCSFGPTSDRPVQQQIVS